MITLILFNTLLIFVIAVLLFVIKKYTHGEKIERFIFLISPIATILCHYSSLIYTLFTGGDAIAYVSSNPNLILPIYPCNIVMWCALFYGFVKNTNGKLALLLSDYIFWFGVASTLVGMFANVDFIMNPTLSDWEVAKSILAHATLLFNVLLIPIYGRLKPNFFRNITDIFISVIVMYAIGLYCNFIFTVLVSAEAAYDVNSMFIIHSPFEGVAFLRYPIIALLALVIYLAIFTVCDLINTERGNRWFNRLGNVFKKKNVDSNSR